MKFFTFMLGVSIGILGISGVPIEDGIGKGPDRDKEHSGHGHAQERQGQGLDIDSLQTHSKNNRVRRNHYGPSIHYKLPFVADYNSLVNILTEVNTELKEQSSQGDRNNFVVDVKLLHKINTALGIIRLNLLQKCRTFRNDKDINNSSSLCLTLRQLEKSLENKQKTIGKQNTTNNNQISQKIDILVKIIGESGRDISNNPNNLSNVLTKINSELKEQIANKNQANKTKDAQLLKDVNSALKIVKEEKTKRCGTSGNVGNTSTNDKACSDLEKLEQLLQDKVNRKGELDETKDTQLSQALNITIKILGDKNGNNNSGGDNNSNNENNLSNILTKVNSELKEQIANKNQTDKTKNAQLLKDVNLALKIVKEERTKRCAYSGNQGNASTNDKACSDLEKLEHLLQDKVNREGELDETKDTQLSQVLNITIKDIGDNNGNNNSGGDNNSNNENNLSNILTKVNSELKEQIANKNQTDKTKNAQLLKDVNLALKIVKEERTKRCAYSGNQGNASTNDKACSDLEKLEHLLQDKVNREGELDETKDTQLSQVLNITIKDIGDNNGNNNSGGDNNSNNENNLSNILTKVNSELKEQIANKNQTDKTKNAQLLKDVNLALKIVKEERTKRCASSGNQGNASTNDKACSDLEKLEHLLQDKVNREGELDETKDTQLSQVLNITIKDIGDNNGNNNSGGDNNSNNENNLSNILMKVNSELKEQIANKNQSNKTKNAQLLKDVNLALKIVKEERTKGCGSSGNQGNASTNDKACSDLEKLEQLLQDKVNREGELDETKDTQLSQVLNITIKVLGDNNGNNNSGGDNNSNNENNLSNILTKVNSELKEQIANKNQTDKTKNAQLLKDVNLALKIVKEERTKRCRSSGNQGNASTNDKACSDLEKLEHLLQDKVNREGELDETKDTQLSQVLNITIKDIGDNNGNNNSGGDNNSNNENNLSNILTKVNSELKEQIANKNQTDKTKNAQLLKDVNLALKIVKEERAKRCGSSGNQGNALTNDKACIDLEKLEQLLQDKVNREGELDETKDTQLSQVLNITIKVLGDNNGNNNSGGDNNSNNENNLSNILTKVNSELKEQIANKNQTDKTKNAQLLKDVNLALKIVKEERTKRCGSLGNQGNASTKDKACSDLEKLEQLLQDKVNREGELDETKDTQLSQVLNITIKVLGDNNGNNNSGGDNNSNNENNLSNILTKVNSELKEQIANKNQTDKTKNAQLLKDVNLALKIVKEERTKRCGSSGNQGNASTNDKACSDLEKLEQLLQDKVNREGELDESKDTQLSQVLNITIKVLGDNHGNNNSGGDNNSNNENNLSNILTKVNSELKEQIANKNQTDKTKNAQLLKDVNLALKIVKEERTKRCASSGNQGNASTNDKACSDLEKLEHLLQDKVNREGELDETKDTQLSQVLNITIKDIGDNNGNNNSGGDNNSNNENNLSNILTKVNSELKEQIANKNQTDKTKNAQLLKDVNLALKIVKEERAKRCGSSGNQGNALTNDKACIDLEKLEQLLQDKVNREGELDETKDTQLSQVLNITIKVLGDNNGNNNSGGDNNSNNENNLSNILTKVNSELKEQIANKNQTDKTKNAQLLKDVNLALKIVKEERTKRCGSLGNQGNASTNDKACSDLEKLEQLLQDKVNREGELDETKDTQLSQVLNITIKVLGDNNGNNNSGGDNNSNNENNLSNILTKVNSELKEQIANKNQTDKSKNTQLLKDVNLALKIVKEERTKRCGSSGNQGNASTNDKACSDLEKLEQLLQDKVNREGELDETKDTQLSQVLNITIKVLGDNNGNNNSGGDNNSNNENNLSNILTKVNSELKQQIANKNQTDKTKNAQLLKDVNLALKIVKEERIKRCGSSGNQGNASTNDKACIDLEKLEQLLQDKVNREGELDETKNTQLSQVLNITIKVLGDNKGNNNSGGDNNSNNENNVSYILTKVNSELKEQIANKNQTDKTKNAQLLKDVNLALKIVKEERTKRCGSSGNQGNASTNDKGCIDLEKLEQLLQDKVNREGELDETKDTQLSQVLNITTKVLGDNNGNNNSGGDNNSNNGNNLSNILTKVNSELKEQIANKNQTDKTKNAQLLKDVNLALKIVKEERTKRCGSSGNQGNASTNDKACSDLEKLEQLLQYKVNREGELDETKDTQLSQVLNITIKVLVDNNGNNNSGGDNNSNNENNLSNILTKVNSELKEQTANKNETDKTKNAQLLKDVNLALKIVKEERAKRCGSSGNQGNASTNDKACIDLEKLEQLLQDKVNREGELDEVKDTQLSQVLNITIKVLGDNNGNNNSGGDNNSNNENNLSNILTKVNSELKEQIANKNQTDKTKNAQLLKDVNLALKIVKEERTKRCGSSGNQGNASTNDKACSDLEKLEQLLQDKVNREGELDETKDTQLSQVLNITIKVLGDNNGNNNSGGDNNSNNENNLSNILTKVNSELKEQIANKNQTDKTKNAQLLKDVNFALKIVKEERTKRCGSSGNQGNASTNDKACSDLEKLEQLLQDKVNRESELDESKDTQLSQAIEILIEGLSDSNGKSYNENNANGGVSNNSTSNWNITVSFG